MVQYVTWTPGADALSVLAPRSEMITFQDYRMLLKEKIRRLADGLDDPVGVMERVLDWYHGQLLPIANPEDFVETAEFRSILWSQHNLTEADFPMKVRPVRIVEEPKTLARWMELVVR